MRRRAPILLFGLLLALLLGGYLAYTRSVVLRLRRDAEQLSKMYARVLRAQVDTAAGASDAALLELTRDIRNLGVPVVVTGPDGRPTAAVNLPFEAPVGDPRVTEYVRVLDRENVPVSEPGVGTVHFGDSLLTTRMRYIPVILTAMIAAVLGAGLYSMRIRTRADRERVWAGMARESAHQLATPLSSLSGWIELLVDRGGDDPMTAQAITHMRADLERLERVAHRFERIGRPPRRDRVDVGALVARVARYFQARVPTLAHRVEIRHKISELPLVTEGDEVLLEWALEALAKNAVDALAGRGGRMYLAAERADDGDIRIRVADDGPGVPRELRARIFEPGFSTKDSGWGIGLSLTKRIVEENHGGRLALVPSPAGATFDILLHPPRAAAPAAAPAGTPPAHHA